MCACISYPTIRRYSSTAQQSYAHHCSLCKYCLHCIWKSTCRMRMICMNMQYAAAYMNDTRWRVGEPFFRFIRCTGSLGKYFVILQQCVRSFSEGPSRGGGGGGLPQAYRAVCRNARRNACCKSLSWSSSSCWGHFRRRWAPYLPTRHPARASCVFKYKQRHTVVLVHVHTVYMYQIISHHIISHNTLCYVTELSMVELWHTRAYIYIYIYIRGKH